MTNIELTLLDENQVFGSNRLDILKKYGTPCAITDFAILLGGFVSSYCYTSEGNTRKDRTSWWWTKTAYSDEVRTVQKNDFIGHDDITRRNGGVRPVLPYSKIPSISQEGVKVENGIKEVFYGEYPQTIAPENISRELEKQYNNGTLETTGKFYTTDSVIYQDYDTSFRARTHTEYVYNGSKYIRFVGDSNCDGEVLSDGRTIKTGQAYWVRVEPITWLVDERANIALSKKLIFSGVQFNNRRDHNGDFENTDIYKFMNTYMVKEMFRDNNLLLNTNENNGINRPINYPSINKRMEEIKKRVKKLQERR